MSKNNNLNKTSNNHEDCGCTQEGCDCHDQAPDCGCTQEGHNCHQHSHNGAENKRGYLENVGTKQNPKYVRMCVLEEGEPCTNCGACDVCDLDPTKICDNCGKCLDTIATNDKGYVEIPATLKLEEGDQSLEDLLTAYGLDGDDEDDE